MKKLVIIVFAVLGAAFFLPRVWGGFTNVAFTIAGFGITWLLISCASVGALTYKSVK